MKTYTATELRNHLDAAMEEAQEAPVCITKYGKPFSYLVSAEAFEGLKYIPIPLCCRQYWGEGPLLDFNEETKRCLQEADAGIGLESYDSMEDLFKELGLHEP